MPEVKGLVSIIVPAYNALSFLPETIASVRAQTYSHWEMIVVNDGSTDQTAAWLDSLNDGKITIVHQQNAGVSAARNHGLLLANGELLVFLDADDLMTPQFLQTRLQVLQSNPRLGFTGGLVEYFPGEPIQKKAVANDAANEILFFTPGLATIPSNYMIRKQLLDDHAIGFNTSLSSTADRFFLLKLSKYTVGERFDSDEGKLLYRVTSQSMSHQLSPKLLHDNEEFYRQVVKEGLLPVRKKQAFKSLYFFSLALGFAKLKKYDRFVVYGIRAALANPFKFCSLLMKTVSKEKNPS